MEATTTLEGGTPPSTPSAQLPTANTPTITGRLVAVLREASGHTPRELAALGDMALSVLTNLESGRTDRPALWHLERIAAGLRASSPGFAIRSLTLVGLRFEVGCQLREQGIEVIEDGERARCDLALLDSTINRVIDDWREHRGRLQERMRKAEVSMSPAESSADALEEIPSVSEEGGSDRVVLEEQPAEAAPAAVDPTVVTEPTAVPAHEEATLLVRVEANGAVQRLVVRADVTLESVRAQGLRELGLEKDVAAAKRWGIYRGATRLDSSHTLAQAGIQSDMKILLRPPVGWVRS